MKVIFLDIDGVLNNWKSLKECQARGERTNTHHGWDPECVEQLRRIVEQTEVEIVISSTWRMFPKQLVDGMEAIDLMYIDVTPDLWSDVSKTCRGDEIKDWIDRKGPLDSYVIIDDDSDMLDEQKPFFVQTSMETGLTSEHANQAIAVMNKENK
jgi:hypothetical protein